MFIQKSWFDNVNTMFSPFQWNNKNPRTNQKKLSLPRDKGGLGIPDVYLYYLAFNARYSLTWGYRDRGSWDWLEDQLVKGKFKFTSLSSLWYTHRKTLFNAVWYNLRQRWVVTRYIYSVTFTWVTFWINCTSKSSFNAAYLLLLLEYISSEESVLLLRYIELHSGRYSLLFLIDLMCKLFVCFNGDTSEPLSHDCVSPIRCSHSRRLPPFNQSDRARQSHDRTQTLRGKQDGHSASNLRNCG